jgi:Holliday junction DNA helicase RuvA
LDLPIEKNSRPFLETADLARLQRTPGVGRKTAERILLELKDRLIAASPGTGDRRGDAVSALVNLGYSQRDALRSVDAVWSDATDGDLGELLRLALQKLTR